MSRAARLTERGLRGKGIGNAVVPPAVAIEDCWPTAKYATLALATGSTLVPLSSDYYRGTLFRR